MKKISVVVVTKNRETDLISCLGSLASQSRTLDELVIIDNNSTDRTKEVISHFSNNVKFPVKYILFTGVGYPTIYNQGLNKSRYSWVAFIDDDCIADVNWYKRIKFRINKNSNLAAISGFSDTYYKNNIFSLTTHFFDCLWKDNGSKKNGQVIDFETLDNKNIVYNKQFLLSKKISFDESRIEINLGASEDCDLGMQIQQAGGTAFFDRKIIVIHKDPTSFWWYYKKLVRSTQAHVTYENKWSKYRKTLNLSRRFSAVEYYNNYCQKHNFSTVNRFLLGLHIFLTIITARIVKHLIFVK